MDGWGIPNPKDLDTTWLITRNMGWLVGWLVGFFPSPKCGVGATFFQDPTKLLFQSMLCFGFAAKGKMGGFFWPAARKDGSFERGKPSKIKNFTSAQKRNKVEAVKRKSRGEVSSIVDFRLFFC